MMKKVKPWLQYFRRPNASSTERVGAGVVKLVRKYCILLAFYIGDNCFAGGYSIYLRYIGYNTYAWGEHRYSTQYRPQYCR